MILPIDYLWSQLNGPQVRGVTNAIFQYWKNIFDSKLDYFNNLTVDSANDEHLTLLGLLSGLIRPTITEADREYFLFSDIAEHNSSKGFSSLEDRSVGGRLTKVGQGQGTQNTSLDEEHYRALLRAWVNSEGEIGSLVLLDEICYQLSLLDLGSSQDPFYRFVFMEDVTTDRGPGDVFINMGSIADWKNPLHVYAVLNGIAQTSYAPQPRLFVSIGTSGRVRNPAFSPQGDIYEGSVTVTISEITDTAHVYYTLDGTTPTEDSTEYTEPITLTETTILKAIGIAPDFGPSDVVTAQYIIE